MTTEEQILDPFLGKTTREIVDKREMWVRWVSRWDEDRLKQWIYDHDGEIIIDGYEYGGLMVQFESVVESGKWSWTNIQTHFLTISDILIHAIVEISDCLVREGVWTADDIYSEHF